MKITVFDQKADCAELGSVEASHVAMFQKDGTLQICFTDKEQMALFMRILVDNFVLFQVQGYNLTLLHETRNFQRVRYRFD